MALLNYEPHSWLVINGTPASPGSNVASNVIIDGLNTEQIYSVKAMLFFFLLMIIQQLHTATCEVVESSQQMRRWEHSTDFFFFLGQLMQNWNNKKSFFLIIHIIESHEWNAYVKYDKNLLTVQNVIQIEKRIAFEAGKIGIIVALGEAVQILIRLFFQTRTEIKICVDLLQWNVKHHQKKRQNTRHCKVLHLHFYATLPTECYFYSWYFRVGKISYNVLMSNRHLITSNNGWIQRSTTF